MAAVIDIDRGWRGIKKRVAELDGLVAEVGIRDPKVLPYAVVHEADHGILRDQFDADRATLARDSRRVVVAAVKGGGAKAAFEAMAKRHALRVKQRITRLGLVDTGALRDSVGFGVRR